MNMTPRKTMVSNPCKGMKMRYLRMFKFELASVDQHGNFRTGHSVGVLS